MLCALCLALGAGSLAVYAENSRPTRLPMKLQLDAKPIDRDTANRVSFSPIVKKTAPSVVYVFSSKKVKNRRNIGSLKNGFCATGFLTFLLEKT